MKYFLFLVLLQSLFLGGCASINSVSVTSIPAERSSPLKVERSKVIVLGLSFDNDFVDEMVSDLQRQCPGGKVTGILTKDEDINYFLYLVYQKRVTASGYCIGKSAINSQKPKKTRRTSSDDEGVNPIDQDPELDQ